jgi:hypothetical protein
VKYLLHSFTATDRVLSHTNMSIYSHSRGVYVQHKIAAGATNIIYIMSCVAWQEEKGPVRARERRACIMCLM